MDDGVYELVGAGSGKALDVSGASRADGARAQIWARNSTMAQMFRVALGPDGFYPCAPCTPARPSTPTWATWCPAPASTSGQTAAPPTSAGASTWPPTAPGRS